MQPEALVSRLLAKDPDQRPDGAEERRQDVDQPAPGTWKGASSADAGGEPGDTRDGFPAEGCIMRYPGP
ncbi:hypothetical protein GCM10010365_57630 [Streptomyces poonensis]|uniref:Uncharacterized protein n=1 Tax=Streptomyces poonensis TaxID=68255 RepID=A0A918USB0_9ACTN|nr:hypothetical protein GCM10010365_57630 [Streptomyces poonensis]